MQARAARDPESAYDLVVGLMTAHGSPIFDQLTKSKTVTTIVSKASITSLQRIIPLLDELIHRPGEADPKTVESHRRASAELLMCALRRYKPEDNGASWVTVILNTLSKYAYMTEKDPVARPQPSLTISSREFFRTKLSSAFAHLMSGGSTDKPNWSLHVLRYLWSGERSGQWVMAVEFDDPIEEVGRRARKRMHQLEQMEETVDEQKKSRIEILTSLYSLVMFEQYNGNSDAVSVLSELDVVCDQGLDDGDAKKDVFELLIELLLALVSKPSLLWRRLAQQAFAAFGSSWTAASLQLLYDVRNHSSLSSRPKLICVGLGVARIHRWPARAFRSRGRTRG